MRNLSTVLGIVTALVIVTVLYFLFPSQGETNTPNNFLIPNIFGTGPTDQKNQSPGVVTVPVPGSKRLTLTSGVERWYTHLELKFSFQLPDGYYAPEISGLEKSTYGVSVYNDEGSKLLVLVYPAPQGVSLSDTYIRDSMSGTTVTNVTERFVSTAVRGLTFRTNDPEWGGDGIGFWAIHDGHLYTVSGARKDEDLMDFILSRWYFAPPMPPLPAKR